jgi:pimeloyl-ACP methyl ester carboxylesterase
MDQQPAVYLGRPCYHRIEQIERCSANLWTHERYSETVVASMAAATREMIAAADAENVTLIGFSGGGVLALLVAQRLSSVTTVITLAANLDTRAWTKHHGVPPLTGSINPADISNWRADLQQVHYIGAHDSTVPPESRAEFRVRVPQATFITLPDIDHNCCWQQHWQDILNRLD